MSRSQKCIETPGAYQRALDAFESMWRPVRLRALQPESQDSHSVSFFFFTRCSGELNTALPRRSHCGRNRRRPGAGLAFWALASLRSTDHCRPFAGFTGDTQPGRAGSPAHVRGCHWDTQRWLPVHVIPCVSLPDAGLSHKDFPVRCHSHTSLWRIREGLMFASVSSYTLLSDALLSPW